MVSVLDVHISRACWQNGWCCIASRRLAENKSEDAIPEMMLSMRCNGQALTIKSGEQAHDAGGPLQKFLSLVAVT